MINSKRAITLFLIVIGLNACGSTGDPTNSSGSDFEFESFGAPSDAQATNIVFTSGGHLFCESSSKLFHYDLQTKQREIISNPLNDEADVTITASGAILRSHVWSPIDRSTDNGKTWTTTSFFAGLYFAKGSTDVIWSYNRNNRSFLWYSKNDGLSWDSVAVAGFLSSNGYSLGVLQDGSLLVVTEQGQYHSSDTAKTWDNELSSFGYNTIVVGHNGRLYLTKYSASTVKYTDDGITFTDLTVPDKTRIFNVGDDGSLYAIAPNNQPGDAYNYIYHSIDNGNTWQLAGKIDFPLYTFAVSGNTFIAGTDGCGVVISTDNGISWTLIGPNEASITDLSVSPSGEVLTTTKNQLISQSLNGSDWRITPVPYNGFYYGAGSSSFSNTIAIGTTDSIFLSFDNGTTWVKHLLPGDGPFRCFAFAPTGTIYAGSDDKLKVSTDQGATWLTIGHEIQGGIGSVAVSNTGIIFVAPPSYVNEFFMVSTDTGSTFSRPSLTDPGPIFSLAVNSKGILYAVIQNLPQGLLRSSDNGKTWSAESVINTLKPGEVISAIAFDASDHLYIGTSSRILRTKKPI